MKTAITFKITKEQILKMQSSASRKAEIESGIRRPNTQVHKSLKDYNRKPKHKKNFMD